MFFIGNEVLAYAGAALFAAAIFYITYTLMVSAELNEAEKRFTNDLDNMGETPKDPFYVRLTRAFHKDAYLNVAAGMWSEKTLEKHRASLLSAGLLKQFNEYIFIASKFWLTLIVSAIFILTLLFSKEPPSINIVIAVISLTFFLPNIHLSSAKKARQASIKISLPYVVDLLTLSMEAGLDFLGAVSKVVEQAPDGPLIEELSTVMKDIQLGKSRAESLRDMAKRIDMMAMSSFVAIIISAEQMGASIGTALRGQSETLRNERLMTAEKLAAQASQKMLIPLVLFILPAVFIMIFAPMVLQAIGVGK